MRLAATLALFLAACGSQAERDASRARNWSAAETHGAGTPAKWSVTAEPNAAVVRCETRNGDETFNLYLSDGSHGPDLLLATSLHADSGTIDRGGGLVWRAQGADDYYLARWNPLEDNLRVYKVVGGTRTMLASTDAKVAFPDDWHDLHVSMVGAKITVTLDGALEVACEDATFAAAGKIGLWTKADASTSFTVPAVRDPEN